MAVNDVTVFDETKLALLDGTHDLDTHSFKVALCDNTVAPTAATATPVLADFTQVGTGGTYVLGGTALTTTLTEAAGTVTFDATNDPQWLQDAGNDTDAYWGIIYNDTNVGKEAIAFVDLGGPVNMTAGNLTITWNANGIFTLGSI
jgi:hypothetical protein